jgi:hypothetical protein
MCFHEQIRFDPEDADRVGMVKWHRHPGGYANGWLNGEKVLMHRFILGVKSGQIVDHVNGDKLDNRRCNLRVCTVSQNQMNRHGDRTKGIHWNKMERKWKAYINRDGVRKNLGTFTNQKDAVAAYNSVVNEIHGAFAVQTQGGR